MAGDEKEVLDVPFGLEDEDDQEYAGGGFEADGLDIVADKDDDDGLDEANADKAGDEEAGKDADEAGDKDKAPVVDIAGEVAKAVKGVTDSFGRQLVNMNAQLNEKILKVTQDQALAEERRNKKDKPLPEKPTDEEWGKDANAAHQKMTAYEKAVEESESDGDVTIDATEEAATPAELKGKQDTSYNQAIKSMPAIDVDGSWTREIFTKIYFNPEFEFNKNPNGPVLAMMATNYYFQSKKLAGDADAGDDVDLDKLDGEEKVEAAQKIIDDARAKKHGMTKSGKKTDTTGKKPLNAEQKKMARQLGVTDESYAEGLAVMGRR